MVVYFSPGKEFGRDTVGKSLAAIAIYIKMLTKRAF
jgi:hypothetical protein